MLVFFLPFRIRPVLYLSTSYMLQQLMKSISKWNGIFDSLPSQELNVYLALQLFPRLFERGFVS